MVIELKANKVAKHIGAHVATWWQKLAVDLL